MFQDLKWQDPFLQRLKIKRTLDYKQDKQLATSGIASKLTLLQRKHSSPAHNQTDFNISLEAEKLVSMYIHFLSLVALALSSRFYFFLSYEICYPFCF